MIICFGEIMLRLSPPNNLRFAQASNLEMNFGGSESNVAVSLAQLEIASKYISRVPDNDLGHAALNGLKQYGVDVSASVFGGQRLGLYFLESGVGRRGSKVIYDRANSGMATLEPGMIDWKILFKNASWFHWSGITPAISQSAADAMEEALIIADAMGVKISCDLNYRANLWKYGKSPAEIMPNLTQHCDVLVGDGDAFKLFYSHPLSDVNTALEQQLIAHSSQLTAKFSKLKIVAMTARQGYSASHNTYQGFIFDTQNVYSSKVYDIPDILDRIGGGDAFMAGLIYGLTQNNSSQNIVEFATAAATLKHYVHGDMNLCTVAEVESLMSGNLGGRVKR